jgi:hypothetical protein
MLGAVNHLKRSARAPDSAARAEVEFTPCTWARAEGCRPGDAHPQRPCLRLHWCAAIVAGLAALLIVDDARVFIII